MFALPKAQNGKGDETQFSMFVDISNDTSEEVCVCFAKMEKTKLNYQFFV